MRGIFSRVSQRIGILRFVKHQHLREVTPLCYFVASLHFFSQSLSIVLRCGGQLLDITFSFLRAMRFRWPGFVAIRVSCHCVIDLAWLGVECCSRLNSNTNLCLFSELPSGFTRVRHIRAAAASHPLEFEVSRCRTFQLARSFQMTFPTLCFTPERWMGSIVQ